MSVDFFFEPATYEIGDLGSLRAAWGNIPSIAVRSQVAEEHQYLSYLSHILNAC